MLVSTKNKIDKLAYPILTYPSPPDNCFLVYIHLLCATAGSFVYVTEVHEVRDKFWMMAEHVDTLDKFKIVRS